MPRTTWPDEQHTPTLALADVTALAKASEHYLVEPETRNTWWAVLDLNQ
jgi:hypothetical protein